eukprot:837452-Rhodomonas_salina.1
MGWRKIAYHIDDFDLLGSTRALVVVQRAVPLFVLRRCTIRRQYRTPVPHIAEQIGPYAMSVLHIAPFCTAGPSLGQYRTSRSREEPYVFLVPHIAQSRGQYRTSRSER